MAHQIRIGDIFWLDKCQPLYGDIAKRRPVVVVSTEAIIERQPNVLVVACTSTALPTDTTAIELPSRERTPQTKTGLNRRTWAIPAWLLPVEKALLTDHIGHLSGNTLRKLLDAIRQADT